MASYNKFNNFVGALVGKEHDLLGTAGSTADTCKVYLSNAAPNAATHTVKTDVAEITAQNNYPSGGSSCQNVGTNTTGTVAFVCTDVVWSATGAVGPFRYVVMYNDTHASDSLISWWDYGSSISLANGETFTVDFGASTWTLA